MRKILEECPTCGDTLVVTELSCDSCGTVIHGRYSPCSFCRLSPENLAFLEVFVRNRGNVKDMERELGVSYWAIRNRLNEVVEEMDRENPPPEPPADPGRTARRKDILEQLNQGKISVAEAADLLNQV
ncbi:MAG: DUF2089 domain-containing protein [Candidatus Promineifilaceae bacterium]